MENSYAVHFNKTQDEERAVTIIERLVKAIEGTADPEAVYRALVAVGTAISAGKLAKQASNEIYRVRGVVQSALQKVDIGIEKRIKDVGDEVVLLLK